MSLTRLALLGPVLFVVVSGCASPWKREMIFANAPVFLYREYEEKDDGRVAKNFAHPATVSKEQLTFFLSRLFYENSRFLSDPVPEPVLRPSEIQVLSEPLAVALAAVQSDERVRILLTRQSFGAFLLAVRGVSGAAFVSNDGKLNLAFDAIDEGVNEGDDGRPEYVTFPYNPTEETYRHGLIAFEGTTLHRDPESRQVFSRWLEVDLEELNRLMAQQSSEPEKTAEPEKTGQQSTQSTQSIQSTQSTASTPADPTRYENVGEKLKALKKLRDDGALTADEYQKEYDRLMKDF